MRTVAQILSEGIRQGLPHITTMNHKQFGDLIGSGHIKLHDITEKTDGSAHKFGYDEHGFYTQYTGSGNEKMRSPADYVARAKKRAAETGDPLDLGASKTFGHIHSVLHSNDALQNHLRKHFEKTGKEVQVKGEMFYKPNAKPSEVPGEVKFVGTSYNPSHMGSVGKYVIHTKLPENEDHDVEHFKKHLSNSEINFDDDKIEGAKPAKIDVSQHLKAYKGLNHKLLGSRKTEKNEAAKKAEQKKLSDIQRAVSQKVDDHIKGMNLSPRWGTGSEGIVVHPTGSQPRFKVTSSAFRAYRQSDAAKNFKIKNSLVKEAVRLMLEGGNMKIGDVSAAPFKITNRSEQAGDIHNALSQIHDEFHHETGEHLFGKGKKALKTGSTFAGSTKQLMDRSIPDKEFAKHKPTVGDVDIQVTHDHKNKLSDFMKSGRRFGKYTVVGTKKHGNENTAVMRHDNGEHHQFDFEGVEYKDHEPTKGEQFLHSSSWEDSKAGIKGAHHKILLNAAGLDTHKFSITHGVRSRTDDKDPGEKEPEGVSKRLFGPKADSSRVTSFHGVADLIKKHLPPEQHRKIYDKFKDSVSKAKMTGSDNALNVLRSKLGISDTMTEAVQQKQTSHASVIPMTGFSPISHMGHSHDLGQTLARMPGTKHVGVSAKSDLFSPDERKSILDRQWGNVGHETHVVSGAGETVRSAYNRMPKNSRKELHILVGHDRKSFAEGLKKSLEAGKIKEMEGKSFDAIHLHYPEDTERTHGMSGTKMRNAVANDDFDTFHKHLGPMFSRKEATRIFSKMKGAISTGKLKVKRSLKESFTSFFEYMTEMSDNKSAQKRFLTPGWKGKASQLGDVSDDELTKVRELLNPSPEKNKKKLNEKMDRMISFRKRIDAMRLVPTRSGSKGDEE